MKTNIIKTAACFFAGTCLLVSCQKDNTPSDTEEKGTVKYAVEVTTSDERNFGTTADWLGGSLDFLVEGNNLRTRMPELIYKDGNIEKNVIVPKGFIVEKESFVYVTFVGEVADFNNVLGYYYYDSNAGIEEDEILSSLYASNPTDGLTFKNIIYDQTKGLPFGTTFKLTAENGAMFGEGTVIGFCIMPNSGHGATTDDHSITTLPNITEDETGRPYFIATDWEVNKNEIVSHIVGQSACGDMVIAFEDLNSNYSGKSDDDFNDLVFVVGDNLESRVTNNIKPFTTDSEPFVFFLGKTCETCVAADDELRSLESNLKYKNIDKKKVYKPLFTSQYNTGYLPVENSTALYAKLRYTDSKKNNTVGWFLYKDGMTESEIQKQIVKDGFFTNIIFTHSKNEEKDVFVRLGGDGYKFVNGTKIGFYIVPETVVINGKVPIFTGWTVRYTTLKDGFLNLEQAQMILKASCDNIVVAFEDYATLLGGEGDYNDVIFSISDNNASTSLKTLNINNANFYDLADLNEDFDQAYGK